MQSDVVTTWAGAESPWEMGGGTAVVEAERDLGMGNGEWGISEAVEFDSPKSEIRNPQSEQESLGDDTEEVVTCSSGDPFEDFDDDDFDDEFDDDFEEEWDEELPGDADTFEPDEVPINDDDDAEPGEEPDFEDEE
ncbi:MAG: hypothetical protein U0805_09915 [Pirellulales bacterium]